MYFHSLPVQLAEKPMTEGFSCLFLEYDLARAAPVQRPFDDNAVIYPTYGVFQDLQCSNSVLDKNEREGFISSLNGVSAIRANLSQPLNLKLRKKQASTKHGTVIPILSYNQSTSSNVIRLSALAIVS